MSLLKFIVSWQEDDSVVRDIEIISSQTFHELHTAIKLFFQLPEVMEGSFFVSDDKWSKGKEISSIVEKNLRDAPALSTKKTPLGALINEPHQKYLYVCTTDKNWIFQLELITINTTANTKVTYPLQTRSEGISPSQFGIKLNDKDAVLEIEEKYDLQSREGFGDEGEEDNAVIDEDQTEDTNFTDDL